MITTEELARIRAIAEADKNGADGKDWDETVTPDVVITLCDMAMQALKGRKDPLITQDFRAWKKGVWQKMSQWRM